MKKNILGIALLTCFCQPAISQHVDHRGGGGSFFKSVEYNLAERGTKESGHRWYNLENKSVLDRILFDDTNSFVEFIADEPSEGINSIMSFRIVKDEETGSYKLEIIENPFPDYFYRNNTVKFFLERKNKNTSMKYFMERKILYKKTEIIMPDEWFSKIPSEIQDSIRKHNEEALVYRLTCYDEALFAPYLAKSQGFRITKELAEKLHDTTAALIRNFKAEGTPAWGLGFPSELTFRCVVGDEVWTLRITDPQRGRRPRLLSDICRQIITDALNNEMNEAEYIKQLDKLKNSI